MGLFFDVCYRVHYRFRRYKLSGTDHRKLVLGNLAMKLERAIIAVLIFLAVIFAAEILSPYLGPLIVNFWNSLKW